MSNMEIDKSNSFGRELITKVRDVSLDQYFMIKDGEIKSGPAKKMTILLSNFNDYQKTLIDQLVINIIDRNLHKMLYMFEISEKWVIVGKEEAERVGLNTLTSLSDGLAGELYSEDGWIAKYSEYPFEE